MDTWLFALLLAVASRAVGDEGAFYFVGVELFGFFAVGFVDVILVCVGCDSEEV